MGPRRTRWYRVTPWMSACGALLGCAPHVLLDSAAGGAQGGSGGALSTAHATAVVAKTFDPDGPCAMNESTSPPDAVFVLASSGTISCAQTLPSAFSQTTCAASDPLVWEICVALPPSSLAVGTIDLTAGGLNAEEEDVGGCTGGACCESTSIFSEQGTLEISAVDASSVTFTLAGTGANVSPSGVVDANGTYTATRCE
jgi:hypothetical protein